MGRAKSLVGRASAMFSLVSQMAKDDVVQALDLIDMALLAPAEVHSRLLSAGRFSIQLGPPEQSISVIQVLEGRSLLLTIHRDPLQENSRLVASTTEVLCEWRCTRSLARRRLLEIVLIGIGFAALRVNRGVPFLYHFDREMGERWPEGKRLVATKSTTVFQ